MNSKDIIETLKRDLELHIDIIEDAEDLDSLERRFAYAKHGTHVLYMVEGFTLEQWSKKNDEILDIYYEKKCKLSIDK